MDETTATGSGHELLLRLAGRVDDDLLADARELIAVGEDGHALELVTATLAAERTPLPPALRAELVAAAREARIDLDVDAALAPAGTDPTAHRFSAWAELDGRDAAVPDAVRNLPDRLLAGVRLRLAWRWTPTGSAPMPLPCPVLLVETPEGGRPGEVLAYQMCDGLRRSGVFAAVEVLTSGRPLTTYHAAALRDSVEVAIAVDVDVAVEGAPSSPWADPEPPVPGADPAEPEVAEDGPARRPRTAGDAVDERTASLFGDVAPAPRAVPMRSWPSGRKRRGFAELAEDPGPGEPDDASRAPGGGTPPLPTLVPLDRRRPAPAPQDAEPFAGPTPGEAPPDPSAGPPIRPPLGPVPAPATTTEGRPEGEGDRASGWTAASGGGTAPVRRAGAQAAGTDAGAEDDPYPEPAPDDPHADDAFRDQAAARPAALPPTDDEPTLLKPESVARLSDADRQLLARLQAELQAQRAATARGREPGAHALRAADDA